jgi:hypothetical protein
MPLLLQHHLFRLIEGCEDGQSGLVAFPRGIGSFVAAQRFHQIPGEDDVSAVGEGTTPIGTIQEPTCAEQGL